MIGDVSSVVTGRPKHVRVPDSVLENEIIPKIDILEFANSMNVRRFGWIAAGADHTAIRRLLLGGLGA